MATFAKSTFSYSAYAAFRPTYPTSLYKTILAYHRGPKNVCIDLGTGPGIVARELAKDFTSVVGTDPSTGMISQAKSASPQSEYPNVTFREASAESLPFLEDGSVDLVVAAQAAHWFDYAKVFPELKRVLRKGGTMAFVGYRDNVWVDYPKATQILHDCSHGQDREQLGPYWQQPGRSIVEDLLRKVKPPPEDWVDQERIEYEPAAYGAGKGKGTMFLSKTFPYQNAKEYVRTWSSFHAWQVQYPEQKKRSEGGSGDVVDRLFDQMAEAEGWDQNDEKFELYTEWGSALILARTRS